MFPGFWNLHLRQGYFSKRRIYGSVGSRYSCPSYVGSSFQ
jgi:hypothetical protein